MAASETQHVGESVRATADPTAQNKWVWTDDPTGHVTPWPKAWMPCCDRCNEVLTQPGGLLFSPPDEELNARKRHLCVTCYAVVLGVVVTNIEATT